jgi:hypothetical protein
MSYFRVGVTVYEYNAKAKNENGRSIAMCSNVHVAQRIVDALNGEK